MFTTLVYLRTGSLWMCMVWTQNC